MCRYRVVVNALAATSFFAKAKATSPKKDMEKAWDAFQEAVESLEAVYKSSPIYKVDQIHQVGAFDLVQSFAKLSMANMVEAGDGTFPHFSNMLDPDHKVGIANPDNYYRRAVLENKDGSAAYKVFGERGTTADFLIQIFEAANPQGAVSLLRDEEMIFNPDGSYEVTLSSSKPKTGNWIELPQSSNTQIVIVRNSFCNWNTEEAGGVSIVRKGEIGRPSPNPTAKAMAARIRSATATLQNQGQFWATFIPNLQNQVPANVVTPYRSTGDEGIPTQFNAIGHFNLRPNEALIITARETDAKYHGFQITNLWGSPPDWPNRQASLSWGAGGGCQAYQSSDGLYRFVLSRRRARIQNWVDLSGLSQGAFVFRLQSKETQPSLADTPQASVVNFFDLFDHLPDDTPRFKLKMRRKQLKDRQNHVRNRYINW